MWADSLTPTRVALIGVLNLIELVAGLCRASSGLCLVVAQNHFFSFLLYGVPALHTTGSNGRNTP